jgi:hypothetical protein
MQKLQDWLTQQWVILWGRKIDPAAFSWLIGPFGNQDAIGKYFVVEFAVKEGLMVTRDLETGGLIPSINSLNLSEAERNSLSDEIVDFYENTAKFDLQFSVQWNPLFQPFGFLIRKLFSNRLGQLNIPVKSSKSFHPLVSDLITLSELGAFSPKYTFWLRSIKSSGQSLYSGVYGIGALASGQACVKAVFPLPNGNATVLLSPRVSNEGELILESAGKAFGDAGFYFLLKDSKGDYWTQYIRSFRDRLIVRSKNGHLSAEQIFTLWSKEVLRFNYDIQRKR